MEFSDVIRKRYSVRKYAEKEIPEEVMAEVIEAGMLAPTAKNSQAQRVYVIKSAEGIEKIRSLCRSAYNAPTVLCFTASQDEVYKNPFEEGFNSGHQDCSIVATHMMLKAAELGLGTCWVNHFPRAEVRQRFCIPENEELVLLMPIGYPAEDSEPSPRHSESKPVEEVVKYL